MMDGVVFRTEFTRKSFALREGHFTGHNSEALRTKCIMILFVQYTD